MQQIMLRSAVLLAALGSVLSQGAVRPFSRSLQQTSSTGGTITVTVPTVCTPVNVNNRDSCFNSCITPDLNRDGYSVNQGSSINFTFAYPVTGVLFGGSPPNDTFYGATIPDMTILTAQSPASADIANPTYSGFIFSPKYATYSVFGGDGTSVTLSAYFFDLATRNATRPTVFAAACRFKITISIIGNYIPPASPDQLYPNAAAPVASLTTVKILVMALLGMAAILLLLC